MVPFATKDLVFKQPEVCSILAIMKDILFVWNAHDFIANLFWQVQDNGEKFSSLLTAMGAYAEGFSVDPVIRRAFYLWKKL